MEEKVYKPTTASEKLFAMKKKIRDVRGSTGAGKTVGIVIWDIDYAQSKKNAIIDIVSESYPHMDQGIMRDFKNIMRDRNYWDDSRWNETQHFYKFETGSELHFQSYDKLGKAHGPRRDVLHLNEANYLPWAVVDQLITRTRKVVWAEYNPSTEFWMNDQIYGKRNDVESIKLTWQDNEGLSQSEKDEIEAHRQNKNWYRVYGEGEWGEIEGRIYSGWQLIDNIPHEARLERHGLDFGFTQDPAVIIDLYYFNGGLILDQILYQKGLHNRDLANALKNLRPALTIADCAEPKSISEIQQYGISIIPCEKGKDSKKYGILTMQGQQISVTKRSIELIKEYRNYLWTTNNEGRLTGETDGADDCLDAARYAITSLVPVIQRKEFIQNMPRFYNESKKVYNRAR